MREELLEFEKKLLNLRLEMTELLKKTDGVSSEEDKGKLRQLESELGYVIRQYKSLEAKMNQENAKPIQNVEPYPGVPGLPPSQLPPRPYQPVVNNRKKDNMENKIGTSFMGILASGLIFISIILFATLGLPYLSDEIKMITCYLVSAVIIAFSMYKLNKQPDSKFYLSLSGCGVGALYISILLTNIYFGYINDLVLFIFISIWVFFMCFLSKIKHTLFAIIGHVGIMIAVIFGAGLCASEEDLFKFIMLTAFFVISTGTLYFVHFDRRLNKNILENVFAIIGLVVLFFASITMIEDPYNPYYLVMMLIILALIAVVIFCDWSESQFAYGGVLIAYAIAFMMMASMFLELDEQCGIIAYILAMVLMVLAQLKYKADDVGLFFLDAVLIVFAWAGLASLDGAFEYLLVFMLALPLVGLGVWKDNALCKYAGMFATFVFFVSDTELGPKFAISAIAMIALYVLAFMLYETRMYRIVLHLLSIVFILSSVSDLINEVIYDFHTADALVYIVLTLFNLSMYGVAHYRKEKKGIYYVVNAIMMIVGMGMISENTPLHLLVIMVVIGAFMLNSKRLLDNDNIVTGIYVGIKFTILLLVILASFETVNYIVSILLILMAIASIVIGFMFNYKSLRVYGLALAMISIFKLVMVDIHYENTLGNAMSFFVSGVLCFAISMIYNFIGKKIREVEE